MNIRRVVRPIRHDRRGEKERTSADRRSFLRQVVAAAAGSTALAVLTGVGGSQEAAAALPSAGNVIVSADDWIVSFDSLRNLIEVSSFVNPTTVHVLPPGQETFFDLPHNLGSNTHIVHALWYVPVKGLDQLAKFDEFDVDTSTDVHGTTQMFILAKPASGATPTSVQIRVFVLHEPQ